MRLDIALTTGLGQITGNTQGRMCGYLETRGSVESTVWSGFCSQALSQEAGRWRAASAANLLSVKLVFVHVDRISTLFPEPMYPGRAPSVSACTHLPGTSCRPLSIGEQHVEASTGCDEAAIARRCSRRRQMSCKYGTSCLVCRGLPARMLPERHAHYELWAGAMHATAPQRPGTLYEYKQCAQASVGSGPAA